MQYLGAETRTATGLGPGSRRRDRGAFERMARSRAFWCIALLLASVPVRACPSFREPPVNFAGITTYDELSEYLNRIVGEQEAEHSRLLDCLSAEAEAAPRGSRGEARERRYRESSRWIEDSSAFLRRLTAAGRAHLALVASQPVQGAYTGQGMASSGGASYSTPSSRTPVRSAPPRSYPDGASGTRSATGDSERLQIVAGGYTPPQLSGTSPRQTQNRGATSAGERTQYRPAADRPSGQVASAPLPSNCLATRTSYDVNATLVSVTNTCNATINVNICTRIEGKIGTSKHGQQAQAGQTVYFSYFNPDKAAYRYNLRYCAPDQTNRMDNCPAVCS